MRIEYMTHSGTDLLVVNAARASFGKESDWDISGYEEVVDEESRVVEHHPVKVLKEKDIRLIDYLAREKHVLPFRHPQITLRCKAPIFLARQLGKHQVGMSWSEESRRYITSDVELYFPEVWRAAAANVKQGSSDKEIKINTYGTGVCVLCGKEVPRKTAGPRGKWCSEKCRASHRRDVDPDFRLSGAKYNAAKRGLEFSLERGDVEWATVCPILGIQLDYTSAATTDNAPSLDRIDSTKGYTKDNVWVISNQANRMKSDASKDDLVKFAKGVLLRFNGQTVPDNSGPKASCAYMIDVYNDLLEQGVAPELARIVLPQNMMVTWVWTGSLLSFYQLYKLRSEAHAQKEARDFAEMIKAEVSKLYPESWAALERHV